MTIVESGVSEWGFPVPPFLKHGGLIVDLARWTNQCIRTYIDIGEIETGNSSTYQFHPPVPRIWCAVGNTFDKSGTLVVWTSLDRIMWRTAKAIIDNSELLIGRMYRYFLSDKKVDILASFYLGTDPRRRDINEKLLFPISSTYFPKQRPATPAIFRQRRDENTRSPVRFAYA